MNGKTERPVILAADRIGFGVLESYADVHWLELVKARMAATGENARVAELAVASTPEGIKAWEEARNAALKRA